MEFISDVEQESKRVAKDVVNPILQSIIQNAVEQVADGRREASGLMGIPSDSSSDSEFGEEKHGEPRPFWMTEPFGEVVTRAGLETVTGNLGAMRDAVNNASQVFGEGQARSAGALADLQNSFSLEAIQNKQMTNSIEDLVRLTEDADINNDGRISKLELAVSKSGKDIGEEIRGLHPLVARAMNENSFRVKLTKKPDLEDLRQRESNQVDMVQEGYANFLSDANLFNVSY